MKINFFRKKNELQSDFPIAQFDLSLDHSSVYPLFLSLEKDNVYAYSTRFMVKPDDLFVVEHMIELFFNGWLTKEKSVFVESDKKIICYKFKEFEQDIVRIITNHNDFITCLCGKGLEPPNPESVFPDRDFGAYGSLQGDMEFWWDVYWRPFWSSLADEEKIQYLEGSDLSEDTIQFLKCHN